ncbi:hypothetical protein CB1_002805001 [Camelus ferus]|nr:hypothetical protein CB1_002805001 [Camelus ferus]
MTATLRNLPLRKCCLTDESKLLHPFVFGQYRRTWFYITTVEVPDSSILKKDSACPGVTSTRLDHSSLLVHIDTDKLEALQMCPGYVAGFVDLEVRNRSDLIDVFVNLAVSEITSAPPAKENKKLALRGQDNGQTA